MYRLLSFDGVTLPVARSVFEGGPGPGVAGAVMLPGGGAWDGWGSGNSRSGPYQIGYSCVAEGASISALRTTLDAIRAKAGERGTLTRRLIGGSEDHTVTARLLSVEISTKPEHSLTARPHQPLTLTWEVLSSVWSGADGTVSGSLDSSPKNVTVANDGNIPVEDAVVTITAAGSAITSCTVAVSGISSWTYSGSIAVGESLVVDCGAMSVQNNGSDDYDNFALDGGHVIDAWLRLEAGNNTVAISRTGGSAASGYEVAFSDGWA